MKRFIFVLAITAFISIDFSCNKAHDNIYDEQKITIYNETNSSAQIEIHSLDESAEKTLGTVTANSSKTFSINWRNDCHYNFRAFTNNYIYYGDNINVCGGGKWYFP